MGIIRYSGIGSRETPDNVLVVMEKLGAAFAKKGFVLRSGGAEGADSAFERGCDAGNGEKEIYLPWKGFNGNNSDLYNLCDEAFQIAWDFHPNLYGTTGGTQKLMARNTYQVLGLDCKTKADFIACYCPLDKKGNWRGGTSQALRIAKSHNIPIFNLLSKEDLDSLKNFVNQLSTI